MKIEVDVEQFARDIKAGKSIGGSDGALGSLIKQLTEAALAARDRLSPCSRPYKKQKKRLLFKDYEKRSWSI